MKKMHLLAALLTACFISCATVSCGETNPSDSESGHKEDGGNGNDSNLPEGTISIAKALEIGQGLENGKKTETKYSLNGTVHNFIEGHKSFMLTDGSKEVKVFMFDDDYNKLPADKKYNVNDSVKLKGYIQKYNNEIEIKKPEIISVTKSGSTAPEGGDTEQGGDTDTETLELITVERALAIASEHTDKNPSKEYKCKGIASNVDKTKGKTKFDLTQSGHTISVYYILNTDKLAQLNNNDEVTIKGVLKAHEGKTKEFYKATILEIGGSSSGTPDAGDTEQGGGETTTTPSFDDLTGAITVKEAYNLVKDLPGGGNAGKKYVYGTVGGTINSFGNCDLIDDDGQTKILLWSNKDNYVAKKYVVGDKLLVYGEVEHFHDNKNDQLQITRPDIIEIKKAAK